MSPRAAKLISRAILALAVVMAIAGFAATAAAGDQPVTAPIVVGDPTIADGPAVLASIQHEIADGTINLATGVDLGNVIGLIVALVWLSTGSLIVARQPKNLAGWLFVAIGAGWLCEAAGLALVGWSLMTRSRLPLRDVFAVIGEGALFLVLFLPLLFLLFPDGRPPSRRWRWAERALFASIALVTLGYLLGPGPLNNFVDAGILYENPVGIGALEGSASAISAIGAFALLGASLATVVAIRGRYKRSTGDERQQMRWLVRVATIAAAFLVLFLLVTIPLADQADEGGLLGTLVNSLWVGAVLTVAVGIPAAYLNAIVRHGLWDLDVVIKKTLIVAVVVSGLTIVSAAVLLALPLVVTGTMTGWERGLFAVGVAIGTLFGPLLRLARRIADRIVYGRRATPYEVLTEFSGRIGETYTTEDILPRMAQILASGTGAVSARVLLRVGGELREAAAIGRPGDAEEHVVPVVHQGEELGALALTMPANDPMDLARDRLVRDLAAQAGPVLRNVRLIEDLRASRQRLVAAQDEERRKLERNIHDGVQQQLVALAVRLKLADTLVDRDPAKAHEALAALQVDAGGALDELRDLARGIYPPLLADKGLAAALEAQVRKAAVPTTVDSDGIGRFPQEVESAVYFCALEALNNVAKYAEATAAIVRLRQENGSLRFTVSDDGRGFDPSATSYGTGLQGIEDRLAALGGELSIRSAAGAGTIVDGRLPVEHGGT